MHINVTFDLQESLIALPNKSKEKSLSAECILEDRQVHEDYISSKSNQRRIMNGHTVELPPQGSRRRTSLNSSDGTSSGSPSPQSTSSDSSNEYQVQAAVGRKSTGIRMWNGQNQHHQMQLRQSGTRPSSAPQQEAKVSAVVKQSRLRRPQTVRGNAGVNLRSTQSSPSSSRPTSPSSNYRGHQMPRRRSANFLSGIPSTRASPSRRLQYEQEQPIAQSQPLYHRSQPQLSPAMNPSVPSGNLSSTKSPPLPHKVAVPTQNANSFVPNVGRSQSRGLPTPGFMTNQQQKEIPASSNSRLSNSRIQRSM